MVRGVLCLPVRRFFFFNLEFCGNKILVDCAWLVLVVQ